MRRIQRKPALVRIPHQQVRAVLDSFQYPHHVLKRPNAVHLFAPQFYCLQRGGQRQHDSVKVVFLCEFRECQRSRNLPHAAVQAQLAAQQVTAQQRQHLLLGRCDDSHGYGHIVPAAVLVKVCGSQVDDYAHPRNPVSKRLQGCYGAKEALLHRHVRKAHQMYSDAPFDTHLRGHFNGVYADALGRIGTYKHINRRYNMKRR